jgi:hypothetical protein
MVIGMGSVRRANAPDDDPDPGNSNHEHVEHGAEHEDLNGAETLREARKIHAKHPIGEAENSPRDQARSQQIAWHAPESNNRNQSDDAKKGHRRQIAYHGKAIEERQTIGYNHPSAEYDRENDPDVEARANRRVPKNLERSVRGQVGRNGHHATSSQAGCCVEPGATEKVSQHQPQRPRWLHFHCQHDRQQLQNTSSGGQALQTYHDTLVQAIGPA